MIWPLFANGLLDLGWPDGVDSIGILGTLLLGIGVPILGYVFAVLDYRAYLRSLRRALVVVTQAATHPPTWVRRREPQFITTWGLSPQSTRDDVYAAYRRLAKQRHPDHGGTRAAFDQLQRELEQALDWVDRQQLARRTRG